MVQVRCRRPPVNQGKGASATLVSTTSECSLLAPSRDRADMPRGCGVDPEMEPTSASPRSASVTASNSARPTPIPRSREGHAGCRGDDPRQAIHWRWRNRNQPASPDSEPARHSRLGPVHSAGPASKPAARHRRRGRGRGPGGCRGTPTSSFPHGLAQHERHRLRSKRARKTSDNDLRLSGLSVEPLNEGVRLVHGQRGGLVPQGVEPRRQLSNVGWIIEEHAHLGPAQNSALCQVRRPKHLRLAANHHLVLAGPGNGGCRRGARGRTGRSWAGPAGGGGPATLGHRI